MCIRDRAICITVAFFVRKKSGSLKKIINNKKINVIEYSAIRGGYSAIIFSVEKEKFFFVGHKSGHSNLVQILTSQEDKVQKTTNTNDVNELNQNNNVSNTFTEKENIPISSNSQKYKIQSSKNTS